MLLTLHLYLVLIALFQACTSWIANWVPGEVYAQWLPGDAIVYVNRSDQAWEPCFEDPRTPCKEKFIPIGKLERVSSDVVSLGRGYYACKVKTADDLGLINSDCTRSGWSKADCTDRSLFSDPNLCLRGGYQKGD